MWNHCACCLLYNLLIVPDCKVVNVYYIFQPVWYKEVLLQVPGKASPYPNCLQVTPPELNAFKRQIFAGGNWRSMAGFTRTLDQMWNVEDAMLLFLEVTLGMASWVNLLLQWLEECSFVCVWHNFLKGKMHDLLKVKIDLIVQLSRLRALLELSGW